jgi:hypothetical protein
VSRFVLHDGLVLLHVLPEATSEEQAWQGRMGFQVGVLPGAPSAGQDATVGWRLVDGVWTAPEALPAPRLVWATEFAARFTDAEYAAIKAARATLPWVDRLWDMLFDSRQQRVDLDYAPLVLGLDALELAGLIDAGRAQELRA